MTSNAVQQVHCYKARFTFTHHRLRIVIAGGMLESICSKVLGD
jgi:hypothetical protein